VLGEDAGVRAEDFDLAATPVSAGFYPHPRRFDTLGPLVAPADPDRRAAATLAWRKRFEAALGRGAHLESCDGVRSEAWIAHLALADAFVVPGGAEHALAEACATGRPVTIHPAGGARRGPREAARRLVARLAKAPRGNDRGTIRPQQGLERWCSRLVAEGSVLPPRDLERLHAELARRGAARRLGEPPPPDGFQPLREIDRLALRLRALLGVDP
jgi:hypothetical protein